MSMLSKSPQERPTAAQALKHKWFKKDEAILKELLRRNEEVCSKLKIPSLLP